MARYHAPKMREKVWVEGRDGANGEINDIDFSDHTVQVYFPDGKGTEDYNWEDLEWTDAFGGSWQILRASTIGE